MDKIYSCWLLTKLFSSMSSKMELSWDLDIDKSLTIQSKSLNTETISYSSPSSVPRTKFIWSLFETWASRQVYYVVTIPLILAIIVSLSLDMNIWCLVEMGWSSIWWLMNILVMMMRSLELNLMDALILMGRLMWVLEVQWERMRVRRIHGCWGLLQEGFMS